VYTSEVVLSGKQFIIAVNFTAGSGKNPYIFIYLYIYIFIVKFSIILSVVKIYANYAKNI